MVRIGVDIIEIERLDRAVKRHPRLITRLFTAKEQEYCFKRHRVAASLAVRFAAKEAVLKMLGVGLGYCSFKDIEILRKEGSAPSIVLHGKAKELARSLGLKDICVSLSHCHDYATAMVFAS
ncbi:MAG: holo-[acyl-carrier protein] synthase [Clostridia bacterium]|nr:holo-[acyl-carrier protein] synthase [Clostridia bacterium]